MENIAIFPDSYNCIEVSRIPGLFYKFFVVLYVELIGYFWYSS